MALQRQKKTRNVWSCERLDHSESKADGYVTMLSSILGLTESILDGSRSWWFRKAPSWMNWNDWVKLTNFMRRGVSHNLRAWRYIFQAIVSCGERRLRTQRLACRASHELSWLSLARDFLGIYKFSESQITALLIFP